MSIKWWDFIFVVILILVMGLPIAISHENEINKLEDRIDYLETTYGNATVFIEHTLLKIQK